MTAIVTRVSKGSALTWAEMDANLNNLNTDKVEVSALASYETSSHASATYETITNVTAGLAGKANTSHTHTTSAITDYNTATDTRADNRITAAVGVSVQAYDVNTAKTNVAQQFTARQRTSPVTDNDLSFDLSAANDFVCTPTAGGTFTFTNITAGCKGEVLLVNGSNYSITKAASVKSDSTFLTKISATGRYIIAYRCLDGTNVDVTVSGALS